MKKAIHHFNLNIQKVKNLGGIHEAINKMITSQFDISDIQRCQLVMCVSAFDYFIHEIVRIGMLQIYKKERKQTKSYVDFNVSLKSIDDVRLAKESDAWLDQEIRLRHSWRSFQYADKVAEALRLVSNIKIWQEVANDFKDSVENVKKNHNSIIERRNKIAHEADMKPSFIPERWPIDKEMIDLSVSTIERTAKIIYNLQKNPIQIEEK